MKLGRKLIFQVQEEVEVDSKNPAGLVARLHKKLVFHTRHPVEASGAQIHPFKVVPTVSRASWATSTTQQQTDLTKLCETGLATTTLHHPPHTHTRHTTHDTCPVSTGTREKLNLQPQMASTRRNKMV